MSLEFNSSINRNTFFQVVDGQNTSGSLNVEIVDGNNTASVTIHANTQINSTGPGVGRLAYLSQCFYNEPNILVPILNPGSYSPGGGQITITSETLARQLGRFYIGKTLTMLFFSVQTYSTVSTTPIPLPNEFLIPGGSSNKYGGLQTLTEFIVQPCNAPTMIAATPHNMQVILSWNVPSYDGGNPITNYIVQYSVNANDWVTFQNTSNTSIPVTGLTNGLMYYFQVAAVNGWCNQDGPASGPFSNTVTATPVMTPDAPTNLVAVPGLKSVSLTWDAPLNNGGNPITLYTVQYRVHNASNPNTWTTASSSISGATNQRNDGTYFRGGGVAHHSF